MENIHRCPVSDFPLSVYILLILLLLLFLVPQFAGLCSKQKQMGNICPGDLGAPRSSCKRLPAAFLPPSGGSSLLYSDKPFFRTAAPAGPPHAAGRGAARGRGCVHPAPEKAGGEDPLTGLPRPAQALPRVLLSFARRGNTTTGNKTAHARSKRRN